MTLTENPFGTSISTEDILDTLGFFDDWEERYKYIIDLGKQLPVMSDSKKNRTVPAARLSEPGVDRQRTE